MEGNEVWLEGRSKDKVEETGGIILNGTSNGDVNGENTYGGRRDNSVVDYVITNEVDLSD